MEKKELSKEMSIEERRIRALRITFIIFISYIIFSKATNYFFDRAIENIEEQTVAYESEEHYTEEFNLLTKM